MSRVARRGFLLSVAALAVVAASSCRREPPSNIDRNKPPETYVTRAPAESTLAYYRVHFYWNGADPDGSIAYYEIAVTDSNETPGQDLEEGTGYSRTLRTDSLFVLRADPPIEQQILGHRFYVRAVDNEGKMDPTPALAYFAAKNDYYPEVDFHPGLGRWTDACNGTRTRVLTSGSLSTPTDTVGVEGTVRWSWGGRDRDPAGSVAGYVYKLGSQLSYRGGAAGDTAFEFTFPRNAARRQIFQVRAIDDGGLRSLDDYLRTVIVNFDPITWVVNPAPEVPPPPGGGPVHARVFRQLPSGTQYWPSGTTLPDGFRSVEVSYTAFDDPRDKKAVCGDPGITRYQARRLFRDDSFGSPGGPAFGDLVPLAAYPGVNASPFFSLGSGDHFILIRAKDDFLIVDSTPETVLVKVNYPPYFVQCRVRPVSAPESAAVDLLAHAFSDVITIRLAEGESLNVTALGRDVHYVNPLLAPVPDTLADVYDSTLVVADEVGSVNPAEAYRAFFDAVFEPGFEPAPGLDPARPYSIDLAVPGPGLYTLFVDVKDRTSYNPATGRRGRVVRHIRIER